MEIKVKSVKLGFGIQKVPIYKNDKRHTRGKRITGYEDKVCCTANLKVEDNSTVRVGEVISWNSMNFLITSTALGNITCSSVKLAELIDSLEINENALKACVIYRPYVEG